MAPFFVKSLASGRSFCFYSGSLERNSMAELAAMAPSEEAVTSWRKFLERQSPAAKRPARLVEQVSSVIMKPD